LPASSWRVASPSPDYIGSLHASSWRAASAVSGVRPDQFLERIGSAPASSWRGAPTVSGVRPDQYLGNSREDEARWRRSSRERIRPGDYRTQSVIAQRNGRVTNRGRTVFCKRESQPSALSVGPHASCWRGVTDSSETVQDHIGEPASSWRVASPSPDLTGSLHASTWRGAPTVSGVRPDQYR